MMPDFKGKKVLIMGLGLHGGGAATVRFFAKHGAKITVTDLRSRQELAPSVAALKNIRGIKYVLGIHRAKDFKEADLIIKNPGVSQDSKFLKLARRLRIPITSDMGIFFACLRRQANANATIIAVTGTRGKSTTAYLIWKFLKTKFPRVYLGGNIRKSVLEFLGALKKNDKVVLELSSFQLADLAGEKKSPHIAVLTNIYRDHLNWHKNMRDYLAAKSVLFKFQNLHDYLFANPQDKRVRLLAKDAPGRVVFPKIPPDLRQIAAKNLGEHYISSVALAAVVAKHFGVSHASIKKILQKFSGLPERQEEVANISGVRFINDTTATSPDAAVAALRRFRPIAGKNKLILIAGGQDKKLDFKELVKEINKKADAVVFLPGTATKILSKKVPKSKWQIAASMSYAVKKAWRQAQKGDVILLSPGAASFGLFLNEFDRGKKFVEAIHHVSRYR